MKSDCLEIRLYHGSCINCGPTGETVSEGRLTNKTNDSYQKEKYYKAMGIVAARTCEDFGLDLVWYSLVSSEEEAQKLISYLREQALEVNSLFEPCRSAHSRIAFQRKICLSGKTEKDKPDLKRILSESNLIFDFYLDIDESSRHWEELFDSP